MFQYGAPHFHGTGNRIHADQRQRHSPPVGTGQPQSNRQGQRPASEVGDGHRRFGVANGDGQIQTRQEAGQPHKIPRQKITQICRHIPGRAPVGTPEPTALIGEHGGQVTDGLRQIGAVVAGQRHHRIQRLGELRQRVAAKSVQRRKQRAAHRMPCRVLDRRGHGPYRAVGTRRIRLAEARTRPTGAAFSGTVLRIVSGTPLPCMAVPGGTFLIGATVLPGCGALFRRATGRGTRGPLFGSPRVVSTFRGG